LRELNIFRNQKNLKNILFKIWTFGFFRFFKKPKKLGFLKATSYSSVISWRKKLKKERKNTTGKT